MSLCQTVNAEKREELLVMRDVVLTNRFREAWLGKNLPALCEFVGRIVYVEKYRVV